MKLLMTRGAQGEAGEILAIGDVVDVSDELGNTLLSAGRATTDIPKPAPKRRKVKKATVEEAETDGS